MDHSEAVKVKAVERYVLGELDPREREQFEEHCFECVNCASDLKALTTFVTASKMAFEEGIRDREAKEAGSQAGWRSWFRPTVTIPALGALAAIVIFQAAVTIPGLKKNAATPSAAQVYETWFRVQGATRGETISQIALAANKSFGLVFDFTPSTNFAAYRGNLVDALGKTVLTFEVAGEEANKELHLVVPGGVMRPGNYQIVFVGVGGAGSTNPDANEVQRISFHVEFRP